MTGDAASRLRALLDPVVSEHGLLLETVAVTAAGKRRAVTVTVDLPDGPGGVGSDALADVSRAVSAVLDTADVISGSYVLEVSTPGTDRPLTEPRHYRRSVGRLVRLRTRAGGRLAGRVVEADGECITLVPADGPAVRLGYDELASGSVEVELRALGEDEG